MKRIYVAGPITADNPKSLFTNLRIGIKAAIHLLELGYAPFCPFLDYQYFLLSGELSIEDLQNYSLRWLDVSDGILILPGYNRSKGTLAELAHATALKIPIFHSFEQLTSYGWKK